jgi:drug/metabolite transporter (DMT)-like permease
MNPSRPRVAGTRDGLLAAALFALSAPLSKLLLSAADPVALAGLLYLGAGGALAALLGLAAARGRRDGEARLERRDLPWLAGAILVGGVAAPIALLFGLSSTPAASASLLLTLEAAATAGWASLLFRESVGRTTWIAVALVTAGSILLALDVRGAWGLAPGSFLVMAACALWGLDNNLTRHVSLRDPKAIVAAKGLGAGGVSLLLAAVLGRPMPSLLHAGLALALGAVSYGASIVLFVRSLRALGAARTGALFGTAPFLAAGISFLIFREPPQAPFYGSVVLMASAAWLLARERHEHVHVHEREVHAHRHAHDEHHAHSHRPGQEGQEAQEAQGEHAHEHEHERLAHAHPHRPDAHHRHAHEDT